MRTLEQIHLQMRKRSTAWANRFAFATIMIMVLVLLRVVQLKLAPDPRLHAAAGRAVSEQQEMANRGTLYDRHGRPIALSYRGYRLFVDPAEVDDLQTIAVDIAALISKDPLTIERKIIERSHTRFVVLADLLDERHIDAVRQAKLRGVGLQPRLLRSYPSGETAAAIVGMVGFEHAGLGGAEYSFEDALAPEPGHIGMQRDVRRRALWIERVAYQPPQPGTDIRLSIDLVVQRFVEQRLQQAVEEFNAGGGRIVVVDVQSGEILAMADLLRERPGWELPAQDPGRNIHPSLGRNRCVTDPYEPGSIFKPLVWAIATDLGYADPNEVLDCPESTPHITSFGRRIRDSTYYGPSTWSEVLIRSMNSGMAIVAERMPHRAMREAIHRFGFGGRTHCGLPGESPGIVTEPDKWSKYTQTSVSFGHEIAATPVQMVRAFCAIARDGTLPGLRMTAAERSDDYTFVHRVMSADAAQLTRSVLHRVMTEGTGRRAQSERYRMFGKSGTPQMPKREGGGYHEDRYMPSFIAGAPLNDPRVAVICVIDDPDKSIGHYGGVVAGPVVRDVIDHTLQYLGVPSDMPADSDAPATHALAPAP